MKKKNLITTAGIAAAFIAMIAGGCQKEDNKYMTNSSTSDSQQLYDNSIADASFDDAGNVADEGVTGSLSTYRISDEEKIQTTCARVDLDLLASPHVAVIDFGATDCLCRDGNYRRGKIIVSWNGDYSVQGSSHSITFNNYYLNFNKITGTKTVTNSGRNAAGMLTYSIHVNGSVMVDPQYSQTGVSGTINYNADRVRTWIEGENSPFNRRDDVYNITGTANGTSIDGLAWSSSIDANNPLRKEIGFPHFTRGIVTVTTTGDAASNSTIDYSYLDGNRDNLARVTSGGHTYTIKLGMK